MSMMGSYMKELTWIFSGVISTTASRTQASGGTVPAVLVGLEECLGLIRPGCCP